ncbi:hypothetical protein [Streptomyces benahoarensis]|uniref:hypothetical protein n=1 Tax=Streptomyces benahoarensis TaxID=2595054 RepID=UPI00117C034E|nr:hypothetical protein FNJ62_05600 [Streptomyces benahoarensis]
MLGLLLRIPSRRSHVLRRLPRTQTDADYLHADELHAAERAGAVALRPAFSEAPIDGRRFVQDRLTAEADEVWELVNTGARVHVLATAPVWCPACATPSRPCTCDAPKAPTERTPRTGSGP